MLNCDKCGQFTSTKDTGASGGLKLSPMGYEIDRELIRCCRCTVVYGPCKGDGRAASHTNWINPSYGNGEARA